MLEDSRGEGESRLKGLAGIVIKDMGGKPFSEYGRYLANARQVIVVVQFTGWGSRYAISVYIPSRLNAKVQSGRTEGACPIQRCESG